MKWDNVRYLLAVARAGGVAAAARDLSVNHATVLRRINELDEELGVNVFYKLPTGYQLTPAGEALFHRAKAMERDAATLERTAKAFTGDTLTQQLKLTVPSSAIFSIDDVIEQYCRDYPQIQLTVASESHFINLDNLDCDVALRMTNTPPEHHLGQHIMDVQFQVYCSKHLLDSVGSPENLPWLIWTHDTNDQRFAEWLGENRPGSSIALRTNNLPLTLSMLRRGLGACLLPKHLVEDDTELVALDDLLEHSVGLWALTHKDYRGVKHVKALVTRLKTHLAAL